MSQLEHDNLLFMINADVLINSEHITYAAGFDDGGMPGENKITRQIDRLASEQEDLHEAEFIVNPLNIYQLVESRLFLDAGHTVIFMASFPYPYAIQHTVMDCWYYINETRPGVIENNMRMFSAFLNELLLARW